MTDHRPPHRVAVVDALRALALLPVIAVNWVGYPALPDMGPLAPPTPTGSASAQAVSWLLYALVAGKGISLLAFLFGYSQALSQSSRTEASQDRRRHRMKKMLALGLLHGCLIYMGDILTTYAVCGLLMLNWAGRSMAQLRRRAWVLVALNMVIIGITVVLSQMSMAPGEPSVPMTQPVSWLEWTAHNASHYLVATLFFLLLGLPLPMLLMTLGLMAGRLRLFSHPRWRPRLQRWSRRWLWPAVALNIVWASLLWPGLRDGDVFTTSRFAIYYLYPTMLLLSAAVPAVVLAMARHPQWLRVLAPLGRHTLTLYLTSSVLSLLLFSGAGLAWPAGTVLTFVLALAYWGGGLILAPSLGSRRLPLETWLSR
ncbi:DUF418 domain-containing protein [Roseateles amylovorans]|uniref:DUF418 domain-containing protein n=1 Tax=Roseateles amylovorans TaxID=2978473 RepID=A0ABY6B199_9BURK|nr:DUF418 domain-containing protein [Roseateles amylovorans]UXH77764.1 DUF418 domain-containing protein [Roseateles amylovorans]